MPVCCAHQSDPRVLMLPKSKSGDAHFGTFGENPMGFLGQCFKVNSRLRFEVELNFGFGSDSSGLTQMVMPVRFRLDEAFTFQNQMTVFLLVPVVGAIENHEAS